MNGSTKRRKQKNTKRSTKYQKVAKVTLSPAPVTPEPPAYDELPSEKTVYDFEIFSELKKIRERVDNVCCKVLAGLQYTDIYMNF